MSNANAIRLVLMLVAAALLGTVIRNLDLRVRQRPRLQARANGRRGGVASFSPLCTAADTGNLAMLQEILKNPIPIDEDCHGATPLHEAIVREYPKVVRLLLAHNADPNTKIDGTFPPLEAAIQTLPEVVPDLIAHRADVNVEQGEPLRCALTSSYPDTSASGHSETRMKLLRQLIQHGASVNPITTNSNPYFHYFGARSVVTSNGKRLYRIRPFSPLANAVCSASECVQTLRKAGATLNQDRDRILGDALYCHHTELLDPLLELGANINGFSSQGETALSLAVQSDPELIPFLLNHGADPNKATKMSETPLELAVLAGNTTATRLLIAHGARVNIQCSRGYTPLHWAHKANNADIASLLVKAGAEIDR